jgi:hypothetical protein
MSVLRAAGTMVGSVVTDVDIELSTISITSLAAKGGLGGTATFVTSLALSTVVLCVVTAISSANFTFFFKRGSTATFGIETAVLGLRP